MIKVQSSFNITITPNSDVKDLTDKNSFNPNRIQSVLDWKQKPVNLTQGVGEYPDYIKEWNTFKSLEKADIVSVVSEEKKTVKKSSNNKLEE